MNRRESLRDSAGLAREGAKKVGGTSVPLALVQGLKSRPLSSRKRPLSGSEQSALASRAKAVPCERARQPPFPGLAESARLHLIVTHGGCTT